MIKIQPFHLVGIDSMLWFDVTEICADIYII